MLDSVSIFLLAGILLLITLIFVYFCVKRYEFAVFVAILSPWISAIMLPDGATGVSQESEGIGSLIRIILVGLIGIIGFLQFVKLRKEREERISNQFYFLALFLLLAIVSIGYSLDQKYTAIRSLNFSAFYFFLLGLNYWLHREENLKILLNVCFLAISLCLAVNAISLVIFSETAWRFDRFRGLLGHPNSMGVFCMVAYPVLLWKYWESESRMKYVSLALIIICASLHFLTGSRTSLAASIFGIIIWLALMKKTKQLVIFTATIFCSFIIFIGYEYTPSEFTRVRSSSISYLTGRPKIWTASITLAKERPILGYGYSVGGKIFQDRRFHDARLETWSGNPRASLHNGYLSVFIGLGSIGLSLFCISLFFPLWNCFQAPVSPHRAFVLSIISMALLVNWFETAIVGGRSIDSVMMWIAWVVAATENRVDGVIKSKFV